MGEYGTIENLIAHAEDLKGKQKERILEHQDQALLSKRLATINRNVPVDEKLNDFLIREVNEEGLKKFFVEFEFNSLGKRLFGDSFKAGRGRSAGGQEEMSFEEDDADIRAPLNDISKVQHAYSSITTVKELQALMKKVNQQKSVCFDVETEGLDPKSTRLIGVAISFKTHEAYYIILPQAAQEYEGMLDVLKPFFNNPNIEKIGHNLKFDISVLKWHGIEIKGALFDTMIAHFLIEPDRRHTMDMLAEQYIGYTPIPISSLIGEKKSEQISLLEVESEKVVEYAAEDADITWQLHEILRPLLEEQGQHVVFYEIEMPLIPVLVDMEYEGVALDVHQLYSFSKELDQIIQKLESTIFEQAGETFNLNSPKQLGVVLFEKLKIIDKPKKTKTGQYATNEQILKGLSYQHEIVNDILEYRECSKLKSTYVDALPETVFQKTNRIHTTFNQAGAATGRLASSHPNLQNIPIRTEQGKQIRKAFIIRDEGFELLSADYSQIELRLVAEMSGDPGLREAFESGLDVHAATAAKVYGTDIKSIDPDMRRKAKMVNFGILYGISAFGLSQRLGIPRKEAAALIEQYFVEYPGVKEYLDKIISFCQQHGYVETLTGRRRYIRDINSANATIRNGAERTAINSPIQGTAADMIKIAMSRIHRELDPDKFQSRMILQVHDELVFDVFIKEMKKVKGMVKKAMIEAIPMKIPVEVEMGTGFNWLDAH